MPEASPSLEIRAPRPERDREAVLDLVAKVFRHPYFVMYAYCRDEYFDPVSYDWNASRIGLVDGQVVTHWGVWRQEMHIGRARLAVAGVGAVATHADFRKHGFLSRTGCASLDGLAAANYDATMLFGIPGFYHRFGYVAAYTDADVAVSVDQLPPPAEPVAFERVGQERRAELDRLHNRQFADVPGAVTRPFLPLRPPGERDATRRAKLPDGWYAWGATAKKAGKPAPLAGYVAVTFEAGKMNVLDAAGDSGTILAVVGELCRRQQCIEAVFLSCSPHLPVARALRRLTARETRRTFNNQGPMGRTVNLRSTTEKLLPELNRRLAESRPELPSGPILTLSDPRERVTLAWKDGTLRLLAAGPATGKNAPAPADCHLKGGEAVFRLLAGAASPAEILETAGIKANPETRRRLDFLFPEQHLVIPKMDWY